MEVIEQNGSVPGLVAEGEYNLGDMVEGVVKVFRPVGRGRWMKKMGIGLWG
ncbi:hypothetical protein AJ79_10351, partial [Helicocarpus griseus UAMH5409]